MAGDRDALVAAYGRYQVLLLGDRDDRLAAQRDHGWAVDEVYRSIDRATTELTGAELLGLLDDLLHAPEADAIAIGCGPLEDVLVEWPELADDVAVRCRRDPAWPPAVAAVWLDQVERGRVAPLERWLRAPGDAE